MSRAFALTNGITMHPLDPPIATPFADNSSEVIRSAIEPFQLQCQGHRSFVQPLVSKGLSFDLLVGLDWLQKNNPRVDWDHGSLMLSDSDHCYKWRAVYSDAEFHDASVAIRLCTARQIRPYPAESEAYCNYVSTIQKLEEEAQPQAIPPRSRLSFKTSLTSRKSQRANNLASTAETSIRYSPLPRRGTCSWASPVFFVSKKNGVLRLVVDYRGLNSQTQPDKFPLPLIAILIDKISKSKVFSRVDLRNGFYQIRMADRDIFKTSVSSPVGLFGWTVMPMVLINAPASSSASHISPACVQPLAASVSSILSMPSTFSSRTASSSTQTAAPTQFLSKTLSKPETNYPFIDKEWLVVIYALTKWRQYLQQRSCIRIAHKPFVSLLWKSSTQLQDRRARWMDLCMQFSFKIERMSGEDNVIAELLSELPEGAETSVAIASARSRQNPVETHSPAAYALALTASETHARDALMSDIRRHRPGTLYMKIHSRLSAQQMQDKFSLLDDKVYFCRTRLYIPKQPLLRTRLIAEHHDSCYAGDLGRDRTTKFSPVGSNGPL
ncbi:hypothetical protein Efla_001315 [Eimeria flavescens]